MKKMLTVAAACSVSLAMLMSGCGGNAAKTETSAQTEAVSETAAESLAASETTEEETAVESKKALLVVSFGTSYNDSRNITIGGIENALREAFPDYDLRRAFTSQIIIDKLKDRDGIEIDNVTEALDRAKADGVNELLVVPTHLMSGFEYTDLKDELDKYTGDFEKVALSDPLLTEDGDFEAVAQAIMAKTSAYDDGETAIVFMGHGTEADSNSDYAKMQETLDGMEGAENYYIGTVEASPSVDDIIAAIKDKDYKRVVLEPLMVVAGDHANNDMAGDEEDSWKSLFEKEGYEVTCLLEGLGQVNDIQSIYVEHAQKAAASVEAESTGEPAKIENENELLVVSFGTSFNSSRNITIGGIENALREAFPDYEVRRAFTSQIIIDKLKDRDGIIIDNVTEALDRAVADGVKNLVVAPTHLMSGYEYTDLKDELEKYKDSFDSLTLSDPLLTADEDYTAVANAIMNKTAAYDDGKTAIVFMGHGTEADSNSDYAKMQETLQGIDGAENYYIGTVEASPSVEDIMNAIAGKDYDHVVLEPLMVVAGDHANNDMAGDEEDSWKSLFEKEGYKVTCILDGLGQVSDIQQIYVQHVKDAIGAGSADDQVADAGDYAAPESVGHDGMTPVAAADIENGDYEITVDSSSSMFKITACTLHVADGVMTADLTLGGTGYEYLYMGTAEEAAAADEADYIGYTENADGAYVYTVPVDALDQEVSCAAFSKKKQQWYDRTLVFNAEGVK